MVNRSNIKCTTCGTVHTLRISVGHNPIQQHTFCCAGCKEELMVEMEIDFANITLQLNYIQGCEACYEEGIIVNLNPDFTVPDAHQHDNSFPWLCDLHELVKKQQELLGENVFYPKSSEDIIALRNCILSITESWSIIKKGWSLHLNGKEKLSKRIIKEYKNINFSSSQDINEVLFDFFKKFIYPSGYRLFEGAGNVLEQICKINKQEYNRFKEIYLTNFYHNHMQNYYDIFCEYFQDYSEYNQVINNLKYGIDLSKERHATSKAFNKTKMYYGNAYEILTSHYVVLACLNNILQGRSYEIFEKMKLSKYLKLDKSRRSDAFTNNREFIVFNDGMESTLRNASHHKAIKMNGNIVEYRSGGTGALREITYAQYLYMCSKITFSLAALLLLELVISYSFEKP